jgi:hypothetical protein
VQGDRHDLIRELLAKALALWAVKLAWLKRGTIAYW